MAKGVFQADEYHLPANTGHWEVGNLSALFKVLRILSFTDPSFSPLMPYVLLEILEPFFSPHSYIAIRTLSSDLPSTDRLYSTRGGISWQSFRITSPCSSISRNCLLSVRWVMPHNSRYSWLKRLVSSRSWWMINTFQRPKMTSRVISTGHDTSFFGIYLSPIITVSILCVLAKGLV